MNISYNWLKDYLDFNLQPDEVAAALTSIGLETGGVEEVQTIKGGLEGLVIGEDISLADLKGTLELFAKKLLGEKTNVRFRPSYFPFTEPSCEVDVTCFKCGGKGCSLCKQTGWIEVLGAGVVHPNVLRMSGYDPDKYTGFAFGPGIDRFAMFKYGITDIRQIYTNDIRFLEQFDRKDEENEIK